MIAQVEARLNKEHCLNGSWIDANIIAEMEAGLNKEHCSNGSWIDGNSISEIHSFIHSFNRPFL